MNRFVPTVRQSIVIMFPRGQSIWNEEFRTGYPDEPDRVQHSLTLWARYVKNSNMHMAIPEKRSLGVGALWCTFGPATATSFKFCLGKFHSTRGDMTPPCVTYQVSPFLWCPR